MVFQRKDFPGEKVRRQYIDFIQINWALLCTVAYTGFLEKGKGMVVVPDEDFITKPQGVLAEIRITFMAENDPVLQKLIGDQERGWFLDASLSPDRTLLIGFVRSLDDGFSSFRVDGVGENAPKQIHERNKAT